MKSRVSNEHCWIVFWCSACPSRTQCISHFLFSPRSPRSFYETPSTEGKGDLTDQGRELRKGINNLGKWHSEVCGFSALFHLPNSVFYRAIQIFAWLHIVGHSTLLLMSGICLCSNFCCVKKYETHKPRKCREHWVFDVEQSVILPTTVYTTDQVWLQTGNVCHKDVLWAEIFSDHSV